MISRRDNARRGFTLVEILIVVIILGILAAIVIPQFTNASQNARESSLQSTLQTLRSQIQLYKSATWRCPARSDRSGHGDHSSGQSMGGVDRGADFGQSRSGLWSLYAGHPGESDERQFQYYRRRSSGYRRRHCADRRHRLRVCIRL